MRDGFPGEAEGRPTGTIPERRSSVVTLLFTDVVGSTALKQQLGDRAGVRLVEEHHALVRCLLSEFPEAEEIQTAGDSFLICFPVPSEAVKYALLLQSGLAQFNEGRALPVNDRIGLHMGEVLLEEIRGGQRLVHGIQVDTCARVMSLAQAGQILMTRPVFDNARQSLKGEDLRDIGHLVYLNHGSFELKGVEEPVDICEVRPARLKPLPAPGLTEKAKPIQQGGDTVLGWRPAVGQVIPNTKWVLEEKLGEGGFGEVWAACHEPLQGRRVFKFCFQAERVRSLKREVMLFKLMKDRSGEHPNIVKLFDFNFDQPPFFLEEEYVEGRDLSFWCEARGGIASVPLETRLEIIAQAADALQAAHEAGIIHRDVKPGNILISGLPAETRDPLAPGENKLPPKPVVVKLTDFGIGQVISEEALKHAVRTGFTRTMLDAGDGPGRPGSQFYMSPELLSGKPASTRSDIYSLGVVLYQVLVADCRRPVPTDWADDIQDPLLREDLRYCLAGKPQDRFAAVGLLARNLRALPSRRAELQLKAAEQATRERAAYRRGMLKMAGLAFVVLAIIATLAWQVRLNAAAKMRQAEQIRSTTVRLVLANALGPAGQGDWLGGGLWFAEAFVLDEAFQAPTAADLNRQTHRLRINSLLRQSPALAQIWFDDVNTSGGFMPDGEEILLGSEKGYRLYSVNTGQAVGPLFGQGDSLVRISPDGRGAVTASSNSVINLWAASSGTALLNLPAPGTDEPFRGPCSDIQFSPDGRWIAAASSDPAGRAIIWDAETGVVQAHLLYKGVPGLQSHDTNGLLAARFDHSGERLVTTGKDNRAVVWNWRSGQVQQVLTGHGSWVYSASFGQQHKNWLLTCSFDRTARLWDIVTGNEVFRVQHEGDGIQDVQFSPDDRRFATAGMDFTVRIWETKTGRLQPPLLPSHDRVKQVHWSADGSQLAAVSWDGVARVWRFPPGTPNVQPTMADWSRDARCSVSYERSRLVLRDERPGGASTVRAIACTNLIGWCLAEGSQHVLTFIQATNAVQVSNAPPVQAQLMDFLSGKNIGLPLDYHSSWTRFAAEPGGRRFAIVSSDTEPVGTSHTNAVLIWNPVAPQRSRTIAFPGEGVESLAYDPNGGRLIIGSRLIQSPGGIVRSLDLDAAGEPVVLLRSSQPVVHLAFSLDGRWLAAACSDKRLAQADALVWRVPARGVPFGLPAVLTHPDGVLYVQFSPSGKELATACEDQLARVWHREGDTWSPPLRPLRCNGQVFLCGFSGNGRWLATVNRTPEAQQAGTWSNQLRIWDVVHSEPVSLPLPFADLATRVSFVARDTMLFVESWKPPAPPRRWLVDLPVNEKSAEDLLLELQLVSSQRSFLSGAEHLRRSGDDRLSAEQTLSYATGVGPLRPLSKKELKELWLHLAGARAGAH